MATSLEDVLKAVAEKTRLRILNLLRMRSVCVCDLQSILALPQPVVSRHLSILRRAGLVDDTRVGSRVIYSRADSNLPTADAIWSLIEKAAVKDEVLQSDLRALEAAVRRGECAGSRDSNLGEEIPTCAS
ncbi:MAG TPA: metalloregulator ArsR/SmtB family transcription factor [Anaerolineales bacterium]